MTRDELLRNAVAREYEADRKELAFLREYFRETFRPDEVAAGYSAMVGSGECLAEDALGLVNANQGVQYALRTGVLPGSWIEELKRSLVALGTARADLTADHS